MALFLVLISFILISTSSLTKSQPVGFSVDLIHRDSPNSPLFDPSITPSDRLRNAFKRSISRASHFRRVVSDVYLTTLSIGTPPRDVTVVMDSTVDMTWIQCTPCKTCFNQEQPLFDHTSSETYQDLPCKSLPCKNLGTYDTIRISCNEETDRHCHYQQIYNNHSSTSGNIAFDTFTFNSSSPSIPLQVPRVVFGCGLDNIGAYPEEMSGVFGLGGGELSVINQMNQFIHGKFSYCLAKNNFTSSKVNFGANAIVSGPGVVTVPLVTKAPQTLYHISLESISYKTSNASGLLVILSPKETENANVGNMVIDSVTSLTLLPEDFYDMAESSLKGLIEAEPVSDHPEGVTLCYKIADNVTFPNLAFHFSGGEVLELSQHNSFVEINDELVCWAVGPVDEDMAVFGTLAQTDFLVGFDLFKRTVSFKPTDCTNH